MVDEDYRGEVGVVLFNHADTPFPGERVWVGGDGASVAAAAINSGSTRPLSMQRLCGCCHHPTCSPAIQPRVLTLAVCCFQ